MEREMERERETLTEYIYLTTNTRIVSVGVRYMSVPVNPTVPLSVVAKVCGGIDLAASDKRPAASRNSLNAYSSSTNAYFCVSPETPGKDYSVADP
jgi:hypothetical protein